MYKINGKGPNSPTHSKHLPNRQFQKMKLKKILEQKMERGVTIDLSSPNHRLLWKNCNT